MAWFKEFASVGDKMPTHNTVCLPVGLTRLSVYERYKTSERPQTSNEEDAEYDENWYDESAYTISYSQFCALWNDRFPNVIIPAVR